MGEDAGVNLHGVVRDSDAWGGDDDLGGGVGVSEQIEGVAECGESGPCDCECPAEIRRPVEVIPARRCLNHTGVSTFVPGSVSLAGVAIGVEVPGTAGAAHNGTEVAPSTGRRPQQAKQQDEGDAHSLI